MTLMNRLGRFNEHTIVRAIGRFWLTLIYADGVYDLYDFTISKICGEMLMLFFRSAGLTRHSQTA